MDLMSIGTAFVQHSTLKPTSRLVSVSPDLLYGENSSKGTHIHVWHRHLMNCFGIEIYSLAIQIHADSTCPSKRKTSCFG